MSTPFTQILFEAIEEHGLDDLKPKLYNVLEAAVNGQSGKARKEMDYIYIEIQDRISQLAIPPDESELALHHPTMSV
jgi:hypothetical protein